MATPIKSTNTQNSTAIAGVSPAASDLLARLNTQGGNGQGQQMAFSHWMDKHAVTPELGATPAHASEAPKATTSASSGMSAAKLAEQALARTRQQAMMAGKQLEAKPAAQPKAPQDSGAKTERPASARKEGVKNAAAKGNEAEETSADKDDKDAVSFNTAMGDGSAVVRELTPPSTIQAGDAAGMMAWLASLTHGELAHGKAAAAGGQDAGAAAGNGTAGLQGTDASAQDAGGVDPKAASSHGAIALDNALWQSASSNASLQVEAMLGQAGKGGEGRTDIDPLAGLMAGGLKGAGPGAEAAQTVRHESATLPTPVDSPDFAQALAEKVGMWVSSAKDDGTMTAELHLNPAEMGPINVKISLDGQSAHVDFAAAALETRQAIEASLPMLSSALSDVGLNMTGGDVSSQTSQQQFNQSFAQSQGGSGRASGVLGGGDADAGAEPVGMRAVQAPRPGRAGGLDLYA